MKIVSLTNFEHFGPASLTCGFPACCQWAGRGLPQRKWKRAITFGCGTHLSWSGKGRLDCRRPTDLRRNNRFPSGTLFLINSAQDTKARKRTVKLRKSPLLHGKRNTELSIQFGSRERDSCSLHFTQSRPSCFT